MLILYPNVHNNESPYTESILNHFYNKSVLYIYTFVYSVCSKFLNTFHSLISSKIYYSGL